MSLAYEENGDPKESYNEIDVMIVKATEHEFDWNNKDLLLAFNCINKYELPPRILDNPADYAEPEQSSDQVPGDKGCIIERSKNSSSKTEKQAG